MKLSMNRLLLLIAGLAGAVVLIAASTASAGAGPKPGSPCLDDTCSAYLDGYDDQEGYDEGLTYYDATTDTSCKAVRAARVWKSWYFWVVWKYWERVNWCYSGGRITQLARYRWPEIDGPLWSFDGNVASNCSEYCSEFAGGGWAQLWTEGQFHACWTGYCNYKTPSVTITVNGYGGWGYNTSG
jgi:hypothetical protein